jgi:ribosomal protein L1
LSAKGAKVFRHELCSLSRKIALMDLIEKVKTGSSKWIKTKNQVMRNFIGKEVMEHFQSMKNIWTGLKAILTIRLNITKRLLLKTNIYPF